jgi:hypothetical protein
MEVTGEQAPPRSLTISAVFAFLILAGNALDAIWAVLLLLPASTGDLFEMSFEARYLLRALPPPPTPRLPPASLAVPPGTSPDSSVVDQAAPPLPPARPVVQSRPLDSAAALPAHLPPPLPLPSSPPTGPVGQSPAGRTGPPVVLPPPPLAPPRFPPRGWPKFDNEGQEAVPLAARQRSLIVAAIEATRAAQAALAPFGHMLHLVLKFPELPVASATCPVHSATLFL